MTQTDVVVLGAGMIGVSTAVQLQRRGIATALIDRRGPGEETSFGNAGMIETSTLLPIAFPRRFGLLLRHALGRSPDSHFHAGALPGLLPFLLRYWMASRPDRLVEIARALRPLVATAWPEHEQLASEAGVTRLLRRNGWLKLYRSEGAFTATEGDRALAAEFGVPYRVLDREGVQAIEPHLRPVFQRAILWPETGSSPDPGGLVKAYASLFERRGGVLLRGDAQSLQRTTAGYRIDTAGGPVDAPTVVVALGPWSMDLLRRFGVRVPFAVKRGYHLHLAPLGNATLNRPVLDIEGGYVLAPMERGIRITTGVEFALRDAPPTPVQLERVLPAARELFPLGARLDPKPWIGSRPAIADSLPVIGPVPTLPGLFAAFGHAHLGFTLGPPTGRLIAELVSRAVPFCDPTPYRVDRF